MYFTEQNTHMLLAVHYVRQSFRYIHTYTIVLSIFAAITLIADDATAGVHFSVKILQPP